MGQYPTKAASNIYCIKRKEASKYNDRLSSRQGAAELLGIFESRLSDYELGICKTVPSDVVAKMADLYNAPDLKNYYCRYECPLGESVPVMTIDNLDRISIRALSTFRKINETRETFLDIVSDGMIDSTERPEMLKIMETLVISYVGGSGSRDAKKAFVYSVIFAVGTAITFFTLGLIASSTGRLMGNASPVWYGFLGTLMVLMALQTWGIIHLVPSANLLSKGRRRGLIGALLAGILAGIFASPCSTPVLIALLGMIAGKGNLAWGILLMLLYSLGHSALVIIAGTSIGFVQKISGSGAYGKAGTVMTVVMGALILTVGFYNVLACILTTIFWR